MNEIMLLFARPYSFANEKTGEMVEGVSVYYVEKEAFDDERNGFGYPPIKANLSSAEHLTEIPGIYNAQYQSQFVKGQRVSKLIGVTLIEGVSLWNKN
ncbi:MAG: hypothetical protein ACRCST_16135 [Turicibacter sp.]